MGILRVEATPGHRLEPNNADWPALQVRPALGTGWPMRTARPPAHAGMFVNVGYVHGRNLFPTSLPRTDRMTRGE